MIPRLHYSAAREVDWRWQIDWREQLICIWCGSMCDQLPRFSKWRNEDGAMRRGRVSSCPKCGWWTAMLNDEIIDEAFIQTRAYYSGVLAQFDLSSSELPISILRDHLQRQRQDVRLISPSTMEGLVRSVFRDFYDADVEYYRGATNTPDGGIDLVILRSDEGIRTAIQVKRRSTALRESVALVREFVGAMVLEGFHSGMYVTTGEFSSASARVPERLAGLSQSLDLQLVGGSRLMNMIVDSHSAKEDSHPWLDAIMAAGYKPPS